MAPSEWMTATEAAEYLGVSKARMSALIADGVLHTEPGQLDSRVKMIKRSEVEKIAAQARGRKPVRRED